MSEETKECRKLEGGKLYGYTSGVLAQIIPINVVNAYIFIYYVYVVGLNALVVSIGTAVGALIMAFASPFFGYIIDNKKPGKMGKRRPFLLYSVPLLVVSVILVWFSPVTASFGEFHVGATVFLFAVLAMFYINFAMLRSSYLSMTPEQSEDEQNRIQIGSLIGVFSIVGTVLGILVPLLLQSRLTNPDDIYNTPADKAFLMGALPIIGILIAIAIVFFTLVAFKSTDESFLCEADSGEETKTKIGDAFKNIFYAFKDKNYLIFSMAILLGSIGIRILNKNLALFFTFVLGLRDSQFITYILPHIVFAGLGFVVWTKVAQNKGVKKSYTQSTMITALALIGTIILLFPMDPALQFILSNILVAFILFSLVTGYILPSPAISELIDTAPEEMRKGSNSDSLSGSYFGANLFVLNIAYAFGDIMIGIFLMGENAESPFWIGLTFPIAGIVFILSVLVLYKVKLK